MQEPKWIITEPGVLALSGTDFRIEYRPNGDLKDDLRPKDYLLPQAGRRLSRHGSLMDAKAAALNRQDELE